MCGRLVGFIGFIRFNIGLEKIYVLVRHFSLACICKVLIGANGQSLCFSCLVKCQWYPVSIFVKFRRAE